MIQVNVKDYEIYERLKNINKFITQEMKNIEDLYFSKVLKLMNLSFLLDQ